MEHVTWTRNGLKLLIERSRTDAQGDGAEIAIPRGLAGDTCPVTALKTWLELSEITAGPLFRKVNRGGVVEHTRLTTDAVRQILLKRAAKAGLKGTLAEPFSPHVPARRVRHDCLPQWCPGRGDHGSHATPQLDHDAQLRPTSQAQPG